MKRTVIIIPALLMSITLSGCSLLSNIFNTNGEPSFAKKGQEVSKEEFLKEYDQTFHETDIYYDDVHTMPSFVFTINSNGNEKNTTQKKHLGKEVETTKTKGTVEYKYCVGESVAESDIDISYTTTKNTIYGDDKNTITLNEKMIQQASNNILYQIDPEARTYSEKEYPSNYTDSKIMDEVVGDQIYELFDVSNTFNGYDDTKYYINDRIFTIKLETTINDDLMYYGEKVGTKELKIDATYQINLKKDKYSIKTSEKATTHSEYFKDNYNFDAGDVFDGISTNYATGNLKLKNVNLSQSPINGYTKTN